MATGTGAVIGAGEVRDWRAGKFCGDCRSVMPALVAGIHALTGYEQKTWMAGTLYGKTALRARCPAMTREKHLRIFICESLRVPV
jgi:hypothetical protein